MSTPSEAPTPTLLTRRSILRGTALGASDKRDLRASNARVLNLRSSPAADPGAVRAAERRLRVSSGDWSSYLRVRCGSSGGDDQARRGPRRPSSPGQSPAAGGPGSVPDALAPGSRAGAETRPPQHGVASGPQHRTPTAAQPGGLLRRGAPPRRAGTAARCRRRCWRRARTARRSVSSGRAGKTIAHGPGAVTVRPRLRLIPRRVGRQRVLRAARPCGRIRRQPGPEVRDAAVSGRSRHGPTLGGAGGQSRPGATAASGARAGATSRPRAAAASGMGTLCGTVARTGRSRGGAGLGGPPDTGGCPRPATRGRSLGELPDAKAEQRPTPRGSRPLAEPSEGLGATGQAGGWPQSIANHVRIAGFRCPTRGVCQRSSPAGLRAAARARAPRVLCF
jgi:hypothetical protein